MASQPRFTIDKGIPMPANPTGQNNAKYPWRTMEVGDSFFVPSKIAAKMAAQCSGARETTGRTFRARTVDGGCRIWRVA